MDTLARPGRLFPGDPGHHPGRDEVVAYLTEYARDFDLPVEHTRGSALLGWVKDDAQHIADQISRLATPVTRPHMEPARA